MYIINEVYNSNIIKILEIIIIINSIISIIYAIKKYCDKNRDTIDKIIEILLLFFIFCYFVLFIFTTKLEMKLNKIIVDTIINNEKRQLDFNEKILKELERQEIINKKQNELNTLMMKKLKKKNNK